jgi:hypothetical protein
MNLTTGVFLIVIVTSIWAGYDAGTLRKQGATTKDLGGSPLTVAIVCLLIWIIAFPYYLVHRSRFKASHSKTLGMSASTNAPASGGRFCGSCGTALAPTDQFCTACGAPAPGR